MAFLRRNFPALVILPALPFLLLCPAFAAGHALLPAAMLGKMLPWQGSPAFPAPGATPFNPLLFDGIAQFYPWRLFAARTWESGFVPLWNPYQFCGTPFLANDQSATLYPLNVIFLMMPVARAFAASAWLHLFLTGAFLYALLRRRVGLWPALLGAVTWQLSDWQVSWLALPTFLCTSTWIPLALLLVERAADEPRNVGRGMALGMCLGVMLLAGHLQIGLYGLLITAAYGLVLLGRTTEKSERRRLAGSFAATAVIMLMLAAPQLLPTVELSRVSHRAGAHATMAGYAGYVQLAMPLHRLVTLFAPSFFGRAVDYWGEAQVPYSETACFIGVGGMLLACIGAVNAWRGAREAPGDTRARFFTVAAVAAMLVALGTPLNLLSYFGIPGFSQSGSPARILSLWSLCGAILAAYGCEALLLADRKSVRWAAWVWLALIVVPLVMAAAFVRGQGAQYARLIDGRELLVSTVLGGCALGLAWLVNTQARYRSPALLAGFCALAAVDLLRAGYGFNLVAPLAQVYPTTPAVAFLQRQERPRIGGGAGRVAVLNASESVYEQPGVLPPNAATVYQLRDLQGYDSLQTGQFKAYLNHVNGDEESSPLENGNMDLTHFRAATSPQVAADTDAEWIVSPVPLGSAAGAGPAFTGDQLSIYRQPSPSHGRVWTHGAGGAAAAEVTEDAPTRIAARAKSAGDLVIADQWYPGWRGASGNRQFPVRETGGVFRMVPGIAAGEEVSLLYAPASFLLGLYLACAAAAACATILGYSLAGIATNARRQAGAR